MLSKDFERDHPVAIDYEESPCGVTLNVLIGCIRGAVYVPTLVHVCTTFPMLMITIFTGCVAFASAKLFYCSLSRLR